MSEDSTQVGEMIRSGRYFEESRGWYQALYIGPISERSFFLIVAGLASLIAIVGVIALMELMPITSRPGLLLPSDRIDEVKPEALALNPTHMPLNKAMEEFFVRAYIFTRESYRPKDYAANYAFVTAHSDTATANAYAILYGSTNPQSPAAMLGQTAGRHVNIISTHIEIAKPPADAKKPDPATLLHTATVHFTTQLQGVDSDAITQWTAVMQYHYSDLKVQTTRDPATGQDSTITQDPQFQVVSYALTQTP
jgi:type IV secretory pathway component VirB8